MAPFSVTVQDVPDRELGPLLTQLAEAGFDNPVIRHVADADTVPGASAPVRLGSADLPSDWRLVREREAESYQWPKRTARDAPLPHREVHREVPRGARAIKRLEFPGCHRAL